MSRKKNRNRTAAPTRRSEGTRPAQNGNPAVEQAPSAQTPAAALKPTAAGDSQTATTDEAGVPRMTIRINGRFFLILVLLFVALGAGTYALHNVQVRRSSESLRDLADDAERFGDLRKAISYLQQYIRFEPADYDAKIKLADLVESHSRDIRSRLMVAAFLEDVLRNDPERADVDKLRRRVIDLSIETHRHGHALDHLIELRKSKPADHQLISLEGICLRGLGDYRKAVFRFLYAIQLSGETIEHYVQLAATLSFRPDSMPHVEDFPPEESRKFDERLKSWFPRLVKKKREQGANTETTSAAKTAGKTPATPKTNPSEPEPFDPAVAIRAQADIVIARVYADLVRHGRPRHLALLAHASHLLTLRQFQAADKAIKEARNIKKDDPDVLFAAAAYAIAYAQEKSLRDTSRDALRALIEEAYGIALAGARLPKPENLRFLLQLAEIEEHRGWTLSNRQDKRLQHLAKARGFLERCEIELNAYRKSEEGRKAGNTALIRGTEINLLSQQIELIFRNTVASGGAISDKDHEHLVELTGRLRQLGASPGRLELIAAKDLLSKGLWYKALHKLTRVREFVGQSTLLQRQIVLSIVTCLKQLQNPTQQIRILQQSLATDIHWVEGRIMLAGLLESRGYVAEAVEQYRLARRELPVVTIELRRLAQLPPDARTDALARIRKFLQQPELNEAAVALLRTQVTAVDPANAKTRFADMARILDDAIKRNPENIVLRAARVRLEAGRSDLDKPKRLAAASRLLAQYDGEFPDSRDLLITRARISLLFPPDVAKRTLNELKQKVAAAPPAQEAQANAKAATNATKNDARRANAGKNDARKAVAGKTERRHTNLLTDDDRIGVLETIAGCYASLNLLAECRDVWGLLEKRVPDNLRVYLAAAELDLQLRDWKRFEQDLKHVDRIDDVQEGGGAWGDYLRSQRLVVQAADQVRQAQGDPDQPGKQKKKLSAVAVAALRKSVDKLLNDAKRLLTHAVKLQPLWPELHRRLGRIERLQGNREAAFLHYDRAFELGDYTASTCLFVVEYLYFDKKDRDGADDRLRKIRHRAPHVFLRDEVDASDNVVSLMEFWIDHTIRRKDFPKARSFFPEKSPHYRNKVMYSKILFQEYLSLPDAERKSPRGKDLLQESQAKLREAMKEKKDAAEPWLALVIQLATLDQIPDALKAVDEALKVLPDNVKYVTAARCFLLLGKSKQAEEQFLKAVAAQPRNMGLRLVLAGFYFSQRVPTKARSHLELVLDPKSSATSGQRDAARGARIIAIASSGKYSDYQSALAMLQPPAKATLADLITRIRLYQSSPFKRDRLALIDVLDEVDRRFKALNDRDRFQQARLYEKAGRWKDARRIVEDLLVRSPRDPLLLGWLAVELLKHEPKSPKLFQDVRLRIAQLSALQPGTLATATVRAELALAEGKPKEAADAVEDAILHIGNIGANPKPAELALLLLAARFCEKNQLWATAETAYRRYAAVSGKPASILPVATFLSRQGRHTEALQIVREAQKTCKPVEVATAAGRIVSVGKASSANIEAAGQIVADAAKADPKSLEIRWQTAALKTAAGNLGDAKAVYTGLLKESPGHFAILNNLAWLLAMRNEDLPQARAMIEQVILEKGPIGEFLDTRGLILLRMQEPAKALADFTLAAEETDDPEKFLHVAQAHLALRNPSAAADAMRLAKNHGLRYNRLHTLEHAGCRAAAEATGVLIND